ncbi:MAG: hypothetical protein K8H88_09495, partial [Sandaracinaceae bacterium]|nr:hypothetical protein [Sandaracinaceae bacterium]
ILAVSATCSADGFRAQSVCNDDYGGSAVGTASRIWLHRIGAPGATTRVYILVDGYNTSATGSYQLNVRWGDPASDGCATSIPLDITGGGTVLGTITNFTSFQAGSCGTVLAPEAVMRFTGPTSGNVRLTTYSTDFTPDTYLRTACGSGELACVTATDIGGGVNRAEIRRSVTSGAIHYFFVDDGRTAGTYAVYYQPF